MADTAMTSIAPSLIGLVGVFVGGLLTVGANYILAVRKEKFDAARERQIRKSELQQAARMVWDELNLISGALQAATTFRTWTEDSDIHVKSLSWEKYGPVLARELTGEQWVDISRAYKELAMLLAEVGKDRPHALNDEDAKFIDEAVDYIEKAMCILGSEENFVYNKARKEAANSPLCNLLRRLEVAWVKVKIGFKQVFQRTNLGKISTL